MEGAVLALSSTSEVLHRVAAAKEITVEAYTLGQPVLRALEDAARRGTHVVVRLEGRPYDDAKHRLSKENARIADGLRAAGATADLTGRVHAKEISVDGTLYLDEKNWRRDDIVLREDDSTEAASIPTTKDKALAEESRLLRNALPADDVIVESESFGSFNPTYFALKALGRAGAAPRLLVCANDLHRTGRERSALEDLVRAGVRVRVCKDSAKLAAARDGVWLGSANATYAYGRWDMPDWGLCTKKPEIVNVVRGRLEAEWQSGKEFRCRTV
jgi:hypothetical protein